MGPPAIPHKSHGFVRFLRSAFYAHFSNKDALESSEQSDIKTPPAVIFSAAKCYTLPADDVLGRGKPDAKTPTNQDR